jgi:outer membrane cobalamin receptor
MGIPKKFALGALCLTLAGAEAAGPEKKPKAGPEAAATVTVTAEATPIEAARTPNPVRVMDAEAIQARAPRLLAELLPDLAPGQALVYGGAGTVASLYLGGARARDTVVLLDGIRITDASSLSPDFGTLGLAGIERAELLRGPASTLYGADAHGGVVSLCSPSSAPEGFSGSALLAGGNRGFLQGDFRPSLGWGSGWAKLHVTASEEEAAIAAERPFRSTGAAFSLGQRFGEGSLATLVYRNHFQGTPLPFTGDYLPPSYAFTPSFDPARQSLLRSEQLIGSFRGLLTPTLYVEASAGQNLQARLEPGADRYHSQRNQGVAKLVWSPDAAYTGTWMLDLNEERAAILQDRVAARHLALATEQAFAWNEALRAVASLRLQRDRLDYDLAAATPLPGRAHQQAVWKAGLNWKRGSWRLYGSYGNSWNTPDVYALVHNLSAGHGDLNDEKSHALQAGADYERGPWQLRLEAARTWYDQVVNFRWLPGFQYKYENGTQLRTQSCEATLTRSARAGRLEVFVRAQEARNESVAKESQLSSGGALGRPFFTAGLRGEGRTGPWRGAFAWIFVGSSYQYFDQPGAVDGLHSHVNDLRLEVGRRFGAAWDLALKGQHLLQRTWTREEWVAGRIQGRNDAYLVPVFPLPGPTVSLVLRIRF